MHKDRKYEYTEDYGLVRKKGKGRRHANPYKMCMCVQCRKIGSRKSRKQMYRSEARRNNRRLRNGLDIKPIGYTD